MNKALPLAILIAELNYCYGVENCSDCVLYSIEYHTCKYTTTHAMFSNTTTENLLYMYSDEHCKIDCTRCTLPNRHSIEALCVYTHCKILDKLKHPK